MFNTFPSIKVSLVVPVCLGISHISDCDLRFGSSLEQKVALYYIHFINKSIYTNIRLGRMMVFQY